MGKMNLILVTGRSTKQGTGISIGKECAEYREATNVLGLNRLDMEHAFGGKVYLEVWVNTESLQ